MNNLQDFDAQISQSISALSAASDKMSQAFETAKAHQSAVDDAVVDTVEVLRLMNERAEVERSERIKSETRAGKESKRNFVLTIIGITISVLTLLTTLFGILASLHLLPL
ncbi:MAG: hypothetical protein VB078_00225 [Clostridiaceae bacterium]|nr:hypothetical protein [Clostridiaceae bacterium]